VLVGPLEHQGQQLLLLALLLVLLLHLDLGHPVHERHWQHQAVQPAVRLPVQQAVLLLQQPQPVWQ
jgi:hypothetical protein